MENGNAHPLLAQIPLIAVSSGFPKATTLPYTWKALPSTLPPSSTGEDNNTKYVISQSGHAAHPDDIIAAAEGLQQHIKKLQDDAEETIKKWQDEIEQRELAEKRKVAPGWLDREEKILQPTKKSTASGNQPNLMDVQDERPPIVRSLTQQRAEENSEMEKALESLSLK